MKIAVRRSFFNAAKTLVLLQFAIFFIAEKRKQNHYIGRKRVHIMWCLLHYLEQLLQLNVQLDQLQEEFRSVAMKMVENL